MSPTLSTFDIVLMMDPDMDPKRRLGHFVTVVSPIATSITYHHRNIATEINFSFLIVIIFSSSLYHLIFKHILYSRFSYFLLKSCLKIEIITFSATVSTKFWKNISNQKSEIGKNMKVRAHCFVSRGPDFCNPNQKSEIERFESAEDLFLIEIYSFLF